MKSSNKLTLILSIASCLVALAALVLVLVLPGRKAADSASAAPVERTSLSQVAYFNIDQVVAAYQMSIDLQANFEKKAQGINDDLTRRNSKLENEQKELADKLNKGLITRSTAEVQYNKFQEKVNSFQQLTQQKNNELAEEQQVMLNNIANAVSEYVKKYNETKGYELIFSTAGDLLSQPVVTADSALDISQEIIDGLNAEYQASKSKQ